MESVTTRPTSTQKVRPAPKKTEHILASSPKRLSTSHPTHMHPNQIAGHRTRKTKPQAQNQTTSAKPNHRPKTKSQTPKPTNESQPNKQVSAYLGWLLVLLWPEGVRDFPYGTFFCHVCYFWIFVGIRKLVGKPIIAGFGVY
ncbi:hypothetical protein CFREI_02095 [Corynebacterium freiburgense]|nr:hypothetical protein CFREI_02095 [Corynebacterium freiburgense]